ncbi:hypothetical protein [Luteipulveratus mongoliensis]|uniref:Uncharacterized protein n=1 Tax=Luteipulveratus mongoliensis TaxID=571913 RepID=A0A0K1JDK5_9MICO|nr:hypothetical protein [Luteipulveratus mongoliensis]AKU14781.1 hypothetical protein VV02_00975 [Luteipulveratus mongoliensis]
MSDSVGRLDDTERLFAVTELAYDGHSQLGRAAYSIYISALFAGIYGTTLSQAIFQAVVDNATARDRWDTWALPVGLLLVVVLIAGLFRLGRLRGPVLPDLSLVDLVLPASIDRRRVLLPWWQATDLVATVGAGVVGISIGGGMAVAHLTSGLSAVIGAVGGALLGWLSVQVWLRGQVLGAEGPPSPRDIARSGAALAQLRQPELREQVVLSQTMTAALYAGDASYLRREVQLGKPRFRRIRLPAWGSGPSVLAADVLALLRAPWSTAVGLVLLCVGAPAACWAVGQDDRLALLLGLSLLVMGAGVGRLVRGLRSLADGAGNVTLLGMSAPREATLHLVVGLVPVVVIWGVATIFVGGGVAPSLVSLVAVVLLLAAQQLLVAFLGGLPSELMGLGGGAGLVLFWALLPHLGVLVVGLIAGGLAALGGDAVGPLVSLSALLLLLGAQRLRARTAPER